MNKELKKRILSSIILLPLTLFLIFKGTIFFAFFLCVFFFVTSYEWLNMTKINSIKFLGIIYLLFTTYLAYLFRHDFFSQFILVIIICILTDIGGFIFGKFFKGPKLTNISPKKTYAGLIGSFFLSLIGTLIFINYSYIGELAFLEIRYSLSIKHIEKFNLIFLIIILFISLISQIGDLIISYFKRLADIKDTSNLLPGHGGFLDRFDGIIFALPISYLIFVYLN